MTLLPAEHNTEKRFTSTVCVGDKPKTDVHMLSVVITATDAPAYVKKNNDNMYMDM